MLYLLHGEEIWTHDGDLWLPNDMDIFVPLDSWEFFVSDMKHAIGAEALPEDGTAPPEQYLGLPNICGVKTMAYRGRRFEIFAVAADTADLPICGSHSTLLMNIMGPDYLSVGYPRLTLNGRSIVQSPRLDAQARANFYETIGFSVEIQGLCDHGRFWFPGDPGRFEEPPCLKDTCPRRQRTFYDNQARIIALGSGPVHLPTTCNRWSLFGVGCGGNCGGVFFLDYEWVNTRTGEPADYVHYERAMEDT